MINQGGAVKVAVRPSDSSLLPSCCCNRTAHFYMPMEKVENLTQSIRGLEVGQQLTLPIDRTNVVHSIIYQRLMPLRAEGRRWSISNSVEKSTVTVTRVE